MLIYNNKKIQKNYSVIRAVQKTTTALNKHKLNIENITFLKSLGLRIKNGP